MGGAPAGTRRPDAAGAPQRNYARKWATMTTSGVESGERLVSVPAGPGRDAYLHLFALADDSEAQVRAYYQTGELYVYEDSAGHPLGMTLVTPHEPEGVELKAVAVDAAMHGRGIGKRMLAAVLAALRASGRRHVTVGTGNCGIGQLAFYQKAGFRLSRIERDFFSAEKGYPDGLEENGIPLLDMVWMDQTL